MLIQPLKFRVNNPRFHIKPRLDITCSIKALPLLKSPGKNSQVHYFNCCFSPVSRNSCSGVCSLAAEPFHTVSLQYRVADAGQSEWSVDNVPQSRSGDNDPPLSTLVHRGALPTVSLSPWTTLDSFEILLSPLKNSKIRRYVLCFQVISGSFNVFIFFVCLFYCDTLHSFVNLGIVRSETL